MGTKNKEPASGRTLPKSIRHKQILSVAEKNPEASIETIAEEVPSATTDLVENVLDEYGDPVATSDTSPTGDHVKQKEAEDGHQPDASELTSKQRDTLRAIHDHPGASQKELADRLNVTASTICKRVNSIPGFDWQQRKDFVDKLLGESGISTDGGPNGAQSDEPQQTITMETLERRLSELEQELDEISKASPAGEPSIISDPELMHKVLRACLESNELTEDEELRLIETLLKPVG